VDSSVNTFGWCTKIENAELLKRLGYDFIELALAPLQLENKEEHQKLMEPVLRSPLPVKAFNIFFPKDLKIVGPETDTIRIRNYIAATAETLTRAKANILVLGSGASRSVPENWDRERAEEQILDVLSWCADEFDGTGITLVIEPLNQKESNIINSVKEGVRYAKLMNRRSIRVLADFYHMDEEREPLETLKTHKDWLAHIHLADTGRRNPGSGSYDYDRFASILKEFGYTGMISSECKVEEPEKEMAESLKFLQRYWS
jgi:sugar phosphate isomerase/epimerase